MMDELQPIAVRIFCIERSRPITVRFGLFDRECLEVLIPGVDILGLFQDDPEMIKARLWAGGPAVQSEVV